MSTTPSPNLDGAAAPSIWVVEDSPEDFAVLERALTRSGPLGELRRFDRAEPAAAALAGGADLPDLLVVDLNLPGMDGEELVRRIRASDDDRARAVPICMLTSSTRAADRARSRAAGASGYCVKPRRASELSDLAAYVRGLAQPML